MSWYRSSPCERMLTLDAMLGRLDAPQANVMVEYSYDEALELLQNNISAANERLVRAGFSMVPMIPVLN